MTKDNNNEAVEGLLSTQYGDDAAKWAKAFCETFPDCGVDEGTMIGWFANAIEVSHDVRLERLTRKQDLDKAAVKKLPEYFV